MGDRGRSTRRGALAAGFRSARRRRLGGDRRLSPSTPPQIRRMSSGIGAIRARRQSRICFVTMCRTKISLQANLPRNTSAPPPPALNAFVGPTPCGATAPARRRNPWRAKKFGGPEMPHHAARTAGARRDVDTAIGPGFTGGSRMRINKVRSAGMIGAGRLAREPRLEKCIRFSTMADGPPRDQPGSPEAWQAIEEGFMSSAGRGQQAANR